MAENFSEKMKKLEKIVKSLEDDSIDIDKSMKKFEKGINLYNELNDLLKKAENKIEILNKKEK
ncbi:MAG: exodeoxyribonuclease VII small subunit [Bacillota bacterium]